VEKTKNETFDIIAYQLEKKEENCLFFREKERKKEREKIRKKISFLCHQKKVGKIIKTLQIVSLGNGHIHSIHTYTLGF
jgi:hypothetical protein